jgi:hypothetical protein
VGAALVLALSGRAAGADPWLTVEGSVHCSAQRDVIAARISAALAGVRHPDLTVEVELADASRGTTAWVRLARASNELREKRIEAASCEEALDAVVAIAALALGSAEPPVSAAIPHPDADGAPTRLPALRPPERVAREHSRPTPRVTAPEGADRGSSAFELEWSAERWRWLWSVGIDRGATAAATPTLGTGIALRWGRAELRGMLEYGMPSSNEREEVGVVFASVRSDFAAASVHYCRALDAEAWLSLCAGSEARVARSSRIETRMDQPRAEREDLDAGALAVGGASLVYRDATWQPRFDVSALLPALGDTAGVEQIGVRAAIGGSLAF